MENTQVVIKTKSKMDEALLTMGIPFGKGKLFKNQGLELTCGNAELPLWWDERSYWPDGSIKWIFLHTRVPSGEKELLLRACRHDNRPNGEKAVLLDNTFSIADVKLALNEDRWQFITQEGSWELVYDKTETDLDVPSKGAHLEVSLLEDSPIAPLLRIRPTGNRDGFLKDQLIRVDLKARRLIWSRRITWNRDGEYWLSDSRACLKTSCHVGRGYSSMLVSEPGKVSYNSASAVEGYPDVRLDLQGCSIWVEKAWQRSPMGINRDNDQVVLSFYPSEVRKLGISGGTSYRHVVHLCCGKDSALSAGHEVEYIIDQDYICHTGALGQIKPKSTDENRMKFPGFEVSFKAALEGGRLDRLPTNQHKKGSPVPLEEEHRQDRDYFGLQNYGDWPMNWGQYGSKDRRMYSSNEYDTAYVYFQGYSVYGDWRYMDVARQSAIHMSDVDWISTTGDMRYHGYSESAENHEHTRSKGGDLGHYWVDGYWMQYFFSGDVWAKESGEGVTNFLLGNFASGGDNYIRKVWAVCERNLGWPLVVLIGTYEATGDENVLIYIKKIVGFMELFTSDPDKVIEEETRSADEPVVWWRTAMEDGCKPFMVGVILEGLERYHRITGDPSAKKTILSLGRFLIENMWLSHQADFTYELNAFGRGHRDINAQQLIPLFVRGLGYAYEISGDERFREVSEKAFHACLWTLYDPASGGKDIGIIGRTLGAYVTMAESWIEKDYKNYITSLKSSSGAEFGWQAGIKELISSDKAELVKGYPQYDGSALISEDDSFIETRFAEPAFTDSGEISFRVNLNKGSTTYLNQRCYLHMCDEVHTKSCISVITFYTNLHVRIYDSNRKLIEVLEAYIKDLDANGKPVVKAPYPTWEEDEWHTVCIAWKAPGEAVLYLDGIEADRRILDRPVGGKFTRLHIGHKPGNWKLNGKIELEHLWCGSR